MSTRTNEYHDQPDQPKCAIVTNIIRTVLIIVAMGDIFDIYKTFYNSLLAEQVAKICYTSYCHRLPAESRPTDT